MAQNVTASANVVPTTCPAYDWNDKGEWVLCNGKITTNGCCGEDHALRLFMMSEVEYQLYIEALEKNDVEVACQYHTILRFKSVTSKPESKKRSITRITNETQQKIKDIFAHLYFWRNDVMPFFKKVDFSSCEMYKDNILQELEEKCVRVIDESGDIDEVLALAKKLHVSTKRFFFDVQKDILERHKFLRQNMTSKCDVISEAFQKIIDTLNDFSRKVS